MRRVSISPEILPTEDLKNKKERNVGGRNFVSTVRARRFLTSSRPNFQTFCTLAVRKSLLRVVRRGKRTASRRETYTQPSRIAVPRPWGNQGSLHSSSPLPLFATPSTLPSRTKTLPNSIAPLCSLGPETRAPLFAFNFRHPLAKDCWGGGETSRVSSSYPRLHARPVLSPVYSSILILTSFVLRSPWHFSPPFSSKTRFRNLNIVQSEYPNCDYVETRPREAEARFRFPFPLLRNTYTHAWVQNEGKRGRKKPLCLSFSLFVSRFQKLGFLKIAPPTLLPMIEV